MFVLKTPAWSVERGVVGVKVPLIDDQGIGFGFLAPVFQERMLGQILQCRQKCHLSECARVNIEQVS